MSHAKLSAIRITPRKVGLIADQVRAKPLVSALDYLAFSPRKRVAKVISDLIRSAYANAVNNDGLPDNPDQYVVSSILVGPGPTLKRFIARAKGSGSRLLKRTSHITVELALVYWDSLEEKDDLPEQDHITEQEENIAEEANSKERS